MRFYVVQNNHLVEKFMCDNWECKLYNTRNGISPVSVIQTTSQHVMEERHSCSDNCLDFIRTTENRIYESGKHH